MNTTISNTIRSSLKNYTVDEIELLCKYFDVNNTKELIQVLSQNYKKEYLLPWQNVYTISPNYSNPQKIITIIAHGCFIPNKKIDLPQNTYIHYVAEPGFLSCVSLKDNTLLKCILNNIQRTFPKTYNDLSKNYIKNYNKLFPYNAGFRTNQSIDMEFEFLDRSPNFVNWKMGLFEYTWSNHQSIEYEKFVYKEDRIPNSTIENKINRFQTNINRNSVMYNKIIKQIVQRHSGNEHNITFQTILDYFGPAVYIIYTCGEICDLKNENEFEETLNYITLNTKVSNKEGDTFGLCERYQPKVQIDHNILVELNDEYNDILFELEQYRIALKVIETYFEFYFERNVGELIWNMYLHQKEQEEIVETDSFYETIFKKYHKYITNQPIQNELEQFFDQFTNSSIYKLLQDTGFFNREMNMSQLIKLRNQIRSKIIRFEFQLDEILQRETRRYRTTYRKRRPVSIENNTKRQKIRN